MGEARLCTFVENARCTREKAPLPRVFESTRKSPTWETLPEAASTCALINAGVGATCS